MTGWISVLCFVVDLNALGFLILYRKSIPWFLLRIFAQASINAFMSIADGGRVHRFNVDEYFRNRIYLHVNHETL